MSTVLSDRSLRERARGVGMGSVGTVIAAFVALLLVTAAVAPDLIAWHDPLRADAARSLLPPSLDHPFGTDRAGRDVFARVVHGAGASLAVGVGATLFAALVGSLVGAISASAPRFVDRGLARGIEIVMAFPEFLLALVVIAVLGPGQQSVLFAVALAAMPAYARVARTRASLVAATGYVTAATALGVPRWRSTIRHVLPNTIGPLLVMATIGVGTAIVSAAGLSFLGMGVQPPQPEWGGILADGRNSLNTAWWIALFPGLAITTTVICTSVLGRRLGAVLR